MKNKTLAALNIIMRDNGDCENVDCRICPFSDDLNYCGEATDILLPRAKDMVTEIEEMQAKLKWIKGLK